MRSLPGWARVAIATAAGVLLFAVVVPAVSPHDAPFGVVLQGVEFGAVNGLLALGLVLTYRASRVINFSYGAMGAMAGTVGIMLNLGQHWNWFVCLAVGLVIGALTGAAVDLLVMRRFFTAPRLVVLVATIGLAQLFGGVQLLLPGWLGGPPLVGGLTTPLTRFHTFVHPVLFDGDDLLIAVVVPLALFGLSWFLLRTDAGIAVRAVPDNADRAMLLGIPVRRLSTLVWLIAGALASLTVMLQAPSQGVTLAAAAGPQLLLPALAAAVIARMESLPVAFGSAVALGVVNSVVGFNVSQQSVTDVVFLVVILGALLFRRPRSGRGESEETWSATAIVKPIPAALRRLPEVRAGRALVAAAVGAVLLVPPLLVGPGTQFELTVAVIYGMVAVSLVVLSGWSGSISLGQMAFAGVGGVVAGDLMEKANVDLFLSLAAAGVAGAVLALVVGLPALRIKGMFLAVTTLALAVAVDSYFLNPTNFSSLIPQEFLRPVLWQRFPLADGKALYFFCLALLALLVLFVKGLRAARAGRVLLATRDNPRAAEAMAVPTVRVRLAGFVLAGVIAGVAGALYATGLAAVGQHTFDASLSLLVFSMAVIGGLDSLWGVLVGVAVIEVAIDAFPTYQLLITGIGLLVVLYLVPGGLAEALTRLRDRLLRVVALRRDLEVPSLVADRRQPAEEPPTAELLLPADTEPVPVALAVAPDALLSCRDVEISYGSVQILFGVDLDLARGEIVALLGTNGAGKSTLLKGVCGLVPVGAGSVTLDGRAVTGTSPERMARRRCALMPGGRGVFPSLTVDENLRLAGWLLRKDRPALAEARRRQLALFDVLGHRLSQAAGTLSGGEQQMLSMAMALMGNPELLLIDELSLGLAPTVVSRLLEVVRGLNDAGVTVILVEQSVNVALELAERAVFLEKGEVRFTGATAELLHRPDILRSVFLSGGPSGPGTAEAPAERVAPDQDAPVVLECRGVTKHFGGIAACQGVDLQLRQGEILGLIGHNGAGKTTLMDLISGFIPLSGGQVLLGGVDVAWWPAHQRAAAGLGRTFQEARLFPTLTVAETIATALERHLASRDLVAAGLRLPASTDSEAEVGERTAELVTRMGLTAYREKLVGELSTGTRRIVELACVLAQDPAVLLLDEPSGGVAQRETEAMGPLLRKVQAQTGCSILVIEHDMPLLKGLCDRLVALELGEVIAAGPPDEVLEHPRVIESYLGTDQAAINRSGAVVGASA